MFSGTYTSGSPPGKYRQPCRILPDKNSDKWCSKPSGEHTALDWPICDECWEIIRD